MNLSNAVSIIALKTFSLFNGLTDDRLCRDCAACSHAQGAAGQAVVHAGDRTDYVYFVLTGNLKVLVSDEDGREVILTMLGQGELFGEMGVSTNKQRVRPRSSLFHRWIWW